jgi:hypothetical protein
MEVLQQHSKHMDSAQQQLHACMLSISTTEAAAVCVLCSSAA